MPSLNTAHARNIVQMAIEMVEYLRMRKSGIGRKLQIRLGVHSGPLIGAVVGTKKFIYDVFGDTVNTASRMEDASEPMRVNVSEATYRQVKNDFHFARRERREIKGKGPMQMYFVEGARS